MWRNIMFDPVKYLEGTNAESSITDEEVRFLYKLGMTMPQGSLYLELGVHHGRSACLFAYMAAVKRGHYIGIDHFKCDRSSRSEAEGYLRERGLSLHTFIFEQETEKVDWNRTIDMLHIDAGHTEPYIGNDTRKFVPLVKVGGIVAFDDYEPAYPDIMRNADAACNHGHWKDLGVVEGMKCFKRTS
jgi:predicted O-methyltransferase YrrM